MNSSKIHQAADFFNMNDFAQAERLYREILSSQPDCGQAYLGMGVIALKVHQYDKAVAFLRKSCELLPNEASPLINLSTAFNGVNSEVDALTALEYAAYHLPNNALIQYHLGLQYVIMGDLVKGQQAFTKVLQLTEDPIVSYAVFELTRFETQLEQHLPLLKERLQTKSIADKEATVIHYALGNIFHSLQNYNQAWGHFESANLLQSKLCDFKTTELKTFFTDIKSNASKQVLSQCRKPTKEQNNTEIVPVFILGLPRTGSTLLEQLLIEHQDISSAGEVDYLSRDVAAYLFQQTKLHYPFTMTNISDEQLQVAATIYLEKMATHAQDKKYVIDKLPANFQSIGLIYKLFPNAKVLHIKRNTADVALSIFRNYFSQNEPYFCSLTEFKQYHTLYADLMMFWRQQLPSFIHEVSYEQLIGNKTQTIKAILDFCDLPALSIAAKGQKAGKVIKTLSSIQARRPINTKSMQSWQNYAEHFDFFNSKLQAN